MLSQIGENMPEKKHEQVAMEGIKEFDLNGNGCLEYEEFEKLVEFLVIEKGYPLKWTKKYILHFYCIKFIEW